MQKQNDWSSGEHVTKPNDKLSREYLLNDFVKGAFKRNLL